MGIFDGWSEFKTTVDGKTIYYPNSFWGKGFVVSSHKKKQEIQKSANRLNVAFMAFIGIVLVGTWSSAHLFINIGRWYIILFFIALTFGDLIWYYHSLTNLAKGLIESNIRLSMLESFSNLPFSSSFTFLLLIEITSWYLIYHGLKLMNEIINYAWYVRPVGIGVFIFGILASIVFGYMILLRAKAYFSK